MSKVNLSEVSVNKTLPSKIKIIANRMSILFGGPYMGACGCMGVPPCSNTRCAYWWEIVMRDEEIHEKVIAFYDKNKETIESGVIKLLVKRFLV